MATSDSSYDLVVLGAGSGGYACALRAAQLGLSVALIEKDKVGGTCLHRGCIPTKAILHAAEVADAARDGAQFGVHASVDKIDLAGVRSYADGVVSRLYRGLTGLVGSRGITVVEGTGRLVTAGGRPSVQVGDQVLASDQIVLASGSYSRSLPGPRDRRRTSADQRARPAAGAAAELGDRARWRGHRGRVRVGLALVRSRGDGGGGPPPAGAQRGPRCLQGARTRLPQAQDHCGHRLPDADLRAD